MMRSCNPLGALRLAFAAAVLGTLAVSSAHAHVPKAGVGTLSQIIVKRDKIVVTLDLSYIGIWAQAELLRIDEDKSSTVEPEEAAAYVEAQWTNKIAPRIEAKIDGKPVPFRRVQSRHAGLGGDVFEKPMTLYYDLEIDAPGGQFELGRAYEFEMRDTVTKDDVKTKPQFWFPYEGQGDETTRLRPSFDEAAYLDATAYVIQSEICRASLLLEDFNRNPFAPPKEEAVVEGDDLPADPKGDGKVAAQAGEPNDPAIRQGDQEAVTPPPPEPPRDAKATGSSEEAARPAAVESSEKDEGDFLLDLFRRGREEGVGTLFLIFATVLAFLYGAAHALTPGHGKTMVAAYLIGTHGRIRDAFVTGTATTIAHTGSVFVTGVVVFVVIRVAASSSPVSVQNRIIVSVQIIAALMMIGLGLTLFWRRIRGVPPGHSHDHGHGHSHSHGHGHSHSHEDSAPSEPEHGHGHGHSHSHEDSAPSEPEHDHAHGHSHGHGHGHTHSRGHDHDHGNGNEQEQEHSHTHASAGPRPTLPQLLVLGITSGLVPCPGAATILLLALQEPDQLAWGLFLIVVFSLGLGAVLVGLGVLLITGKAISAAHAKPGAFFQELSFMKRVFAPSFLEGLDRFGLKALRVVPAFSCLFIAALGAFFAVLAYIQGRTEIEAMWRWLTT